MLIYTFVENAVKYGLRNNSDRGFLKIAIKPIKNKYQIIIEDNGPGINSKISTNKGTGKGLGIITELIDLYYKLEKVKITYSLQNIIRKENVTNGTRVLIDLYLK
jgi:sensor histidine kinase YesM